MDIAPVSQTYLPTVGGVPNQMESLAVYLRSRGHQVSIVTSTQGPAPEGVIRLVAGNPLQFLHEAVKAIRAERSRVVHGHDPLAAAIATAASRVPRVRSVATIHDVWPLCPRGTYSNTLRDYMECSTKSLLTECPSCAKWNRGKVLFYETYHVQTYRRLHAVAAVSNYVRTRMTERFGAPSIHVIHNWVDLGAGRPRHRATHRHTESG